MAFSKNGFLLLGLAFVVVLLISSVEVSAVDTTQTKESGDHYGNDHGHDDHDHYGHEHGHDDHYDHDHGHDDHYGHHGGEN